jgi:hypothetical protein
LAAIVSTQGVTALALLLAALVVAVHLLSTGIGSRLRDNANLAQAANHPHCGFERDQFAQTGSTIAAIQASVRSPWHGRGSTALSWLPGLVCTCTLAGGVIGGVLIATAIGHRTSPSGVLVGSISSAVLGGWFAFLGGSFYGIFRHGVRDALTEQRKDEPRHGARS